MDGVSVIIQSKKHELKYWEMTKGMQSLFKIGPHAVMFTFVTNISSRFCCLLLSTLGRLYGAN